MTDELPVIKTISDWHRALCNGDTVVKIPVAQGSDSLAQRVRQNRITEADARHLAAVAKQLAEAGYDVQSRAVKGKGDEPPKLPTEYVAQDRLARLIESFFGAWPANDPAVVKKAVRKVANHTKQPSVVVWRMTFTAFHAALAAVILCERLGGPPTPMQRAIWDVLDGCAMRTRALALEVADGNQPQLYYTDRKAKTGGLKEMKEAGCVKLKRTVGYFRPDAPPATK